MKNQIKLALIIFLAVLLSNCAAPNQNELRKQLINLHSEAEAGDSDKAVAAGESALKIMDVAALHESDDLVNEGEQNFVYEAYDESVRIFEMALAKNPENLRANAYLAFLKPFGYMKGAEWRTSNAQSELDVGIRLIRAYENNPNDPSQQFQRFFLIPYKTKLSRHADIRDEIVRPMVNDLLNSMKYWDVVKNKSDLDLHLYLPHVMGGKSPIRLRQADAQTAAALALGMATFGRFYSLYDFGEAKIVDPTSKAKMTSESQWTELVKDPRFGIILDKEFYTKIKDRLQEFAEGTELAYVALQRRLDSGKNENSDFSQISSTKVSACTFKGGTTDSISLVPEDLQITYEGHSCTKRTMMQTPDILTLWGDEREKIIKKPSDNDYYWGDITFGPTTQALKSEIESFKKMLYGPVKGRTVCKTPVSGEDKTVSFWLDLPTYLLNPIGDMKTEGPLFDSNGDFRGAQDKTIHGLFPQGIPCAY